MLGRARKLAAEARWAVLDRLHALRIRPIPLPASVAHRRVVLVGASVGFEWKLHLVFPNLEARPIYQFDKTELVEQAVAEGPDAIILKECAAYFPSADPEGERALFAGWVERIRAAGIVPIVATVVPVTRDHAASEPGRLEGLLAFNDWVRELARREQLAVLDLEAAVRCSAGERRLDDALHSGDGLHLEPRTYRERLDPLVPPLLLRAFTA